jgi:4-hydroxy-3-methylbut-2-enyl diphosphate reductase
MEMRVLLARPRGFCAGVERAIEIVELALAVHQPPVYVRKEIVHNRFVVDDLRSRGAVFVDELAGVPRGSVVIFSAHGVSPAVWEEAKTRELRVIDATCPLVTRVHQEAKRALAAGDEIILIGHSGHEEVAGTMGEAPEGRMKLVTCEEDARTVQVANPKKLTVLTQTTLSSDDCTGIIAALAERFPGMHTSPGEDICYATRNRQRAVKALAAEAPVVLVVGAPNSSNSKRLREVAESAGAKAYLVNHVGEVDWKWFEGIETVGITAGASAPAVVVRELVNTIVQRFNGTVAEVGDIREDVHFNLPPGLEKAGPAGFSAR